MCVSIACAYHDIRVEVRRVAPYFDTGFFLVSATPSHSPGYLALDLLRESPFPTPWCYGSTGVTNTQHYNTQPCKHGSLRSSLMSSARVASAFTTEHLQTPLMCFGIH